MLRRIAPLLAVLLPVLFIACGGSGSGAAADPAAAVPRGVPFYVEVTLRPEGDARDGALAAASKLLRTDDPEGRIRELLQQAGADDEHGHTVDFAKEIEPWLGDRAGLWLALPAKGAQDPGVGLAVAVTDPEAARGSIEAIARRDGKLTSRSAAGRDYVVAEDGTAIAVADDYALVATEGELRRAFAALDGDGLAGDERYAKAIDPLEADRLAHYYLDLKPLVEAGLAAAPEAATQLGPLKPFLASRLAQAQAGSFTADGERLLLEDVAPEEGGLAQGIPALSGTPAPLLKELPADAWAALGLARAGQSLRTVFDEAAGALGGAALSAQVRSELGIDLEQDVFAWMGDVAVFARGAATAEVEGALVIEVTDEARAAAAFGKVVGLLRTRGGLDPQPAKVDGADTAFSIELPGVPRPLLLARGNGRVVAGYGAEAAAAGLGSGTKLGDAPAYRDARDALDGFDPSLLVSLPAVLGLVDATGRPDPGYAEAKPYLDALGVLAAGTHADGGRIRSRVGTGLR